MIVFLLYYLKKFGRFLWRFINEYPAEPLLYTCSNNGVTAVVRAQDFDEEIRHMRRALRRQGKPEGSMRPQVYPVFLFSDKNPGCRGFKIGTIGDMHAILEGCWVENRDFDIPPLSAPGMVRYGYYGGVEMIGREGTRHRWYELAVARNYLRQK